MNFNPAWFPALWQWAAWFAAVLLFGIALPRAVAAFGGNRRAAAAAALLLIVWWSLRIAPTNGQLHGLVYHLSGMTLAVLMLGRAGAFCLSFVLMLPYLWVHTGAAGLLSAGLHILLGCVPPLLVAAMVDLLLRRLPKNVFLYIFFGGFFSAAAAVWLVGLSTAAALYAAEAFSLSVLIHKVLPVLFFTAWGEAFSTGLLTAVFLTFAPTLLGTFSDRDYLSRRPQIWH